ncbi:two-component system, sensor histidine kinase and response regulator [Gammaproteobacteria bacterium]
MNRNTIARQAALRLILSLGLFVVLIAMTTAGLYRLALQKATHERTAALATFYKDRLFQIDRDWDIQSHNIKAGIEFSRLLEDPTTRKTSLNAFFTIQGMDRRFQYLIIQACDGHKLFDFGNNLSLAAIPLKQKEESGYYLDPTDKQLYRIFQIPIWLGAKEGMGQFALFFQISHSVLYQISTNEITLTMLYNHHPIASSGGQTALERLEQGVSLVTMESVDFVWSEKEGESILIRIESPAMILFSTTELALWVSAIPLADGLILWFIIGLWLLRQVTRITALGMAVKEFSVARQVTVSLTEHLIQAQGTYPDEIADVAQAILFTSHEMVVSNNELTRHRHHLEELVQERTAQLSILQEQLQQREAFANTLFETAPAGLLLIDEQGEVVRVNTVAEQIFGYSPQAMLGLLLEKLIPEHLRRKYHILRRRYTINPLPRLVGEINDFRGLHANGSEFPIDLAISPMFFGKQRYVIISVVDITNRKQADEAIRRLNAKNQLLLDAVGDGICGLDRNGRITFVNPAASQIFGWSPSELIGEIFHDRCHHSYANGTPYPREDCPIHTQLEKCVVMHHDVTTLWRRDGTSFLAEFTATPILEEGTASGEVLTFRDITEIETAKMAERANAAKSEFLANMSHEIRTPMNTIIGMGYLLAQTRLDSVQRDQMRKIQAAAQSLLGIIDDILDFSKIEAGQLHLEQISFDLDDILEKISTMISFKAEEKGLEVLFDVPIALPRTLVGDPLRLEQILLNLGTNAVKFSEKGNIVYRIQEISTTPQYITLRFSVQDQGIGLTQEQIGKLFQAFSQADTSTTRHYGGTGLGLTICKRLVEMMGGKIEVESIYGQGSCFSFTAVFTKSPQPSQRSRLQFSSTLPKLRVLVVDDNLNACEILTEILQGLGLAVHSVNSGEEALHELERTICAPENSYQVLLLDWKMPGLNGLATARKIRANPQLIQPTIIMMTAFGWQEVMDQAQKTGIEKFLLKPIPPSALLNVLVDLFGTDYSREALSNPPESRTVKGVPNLQGMRVLIVEDHELNWQVAEGILTKAGVVTRRAENGREAMKQILDERQRYDLVFMDLQMPIIDGYEATRLLRQHFTPEDLPIVAMTAHAIKSEKERCLALGMNDYLTKPVDVNGLYTLLTRFKQPGLDSAVLPIMMETTLPTTTQKSTTFLPNTLPEIDMAQGLQRLDGDEPLLARLIVAFSKNHVGVDATLRELLDAGKTEEVKRFLHRFKGAAGTISARTLHDLTTACEKELEETGAIEESRLQRLGEKLAKVQEAGQRVVEYLANIERQTNPTTNLSPLPLDWLEELREGLSSGSFKVIEQFRALTPQLQSLGLEPEIAGLSQALSCFDFKTGLVWLARIAERFEKREERDHERN